MGNTISALIDEKKGVNETKAVHDLELLQKLVDSQLDLFEKDLDARFLNPDATAKTEVPGIRALRRTKFSTCEISENVDADVNKAIDNFFGAAKGGDKTKDKILDGFKSVVNTALNQFLGNKSIGQKTESKYFIYMHHNAVVRVDVRLWKWNFSDSGLTNTYKSALGYYMCLSIVDVTALKTSEFVYLISEYAGDDEEAVTKYTESMGKMYTASRKLKKAQHMPQNED